MTGAAVFNFNNKLLVKFKGSKKSNCLTVKLGGADTYTMTFGKAGKLSYEVTKEITGVFNNQLQSIFTKETGLYTSL